MHDHLAGSVHAIDLLRAIRDQQAGKALGQFAANLLPPIEADRDTLRGLANRTGVGSSAIKEMGARFEEKGSRLKLRDLDRDSPGTFEALEFLQLGIHGKGALWSALVLVAAGEQRLSGIDFGALSDRSEAQEMALEEWRLKMAVAFCGARSAA